MKKALLFGATGFVGSHLLQELLQDPAYSEVIAVTRKPLAGPQPKLKNLIGDFRSLTSLADQLVADDVFIALGTTKAKTPDPAEYYQIDHDYPVLGAKLAQGKGAASVSIVTAIGANAASSMSYVRLKGEVERDLQALGYARTNIFQPSMIMGDRGEHRPLESAFTALFSAIDPLLGGPLKNYRGIEGAEIARAMARAPKKGAEPVAYYRWKEMQALNLSR